MEASCWSNQTPKSLAHAFFRSSRSRSHSQAGRCLTMVVTEDGFQVLCSGSGSRCVLINASASLAAQENQISRSCSLRLAGLHPAGRPQLQVDWKRWDCLEKGAVGAQPRSEVSAREKDSRP